MLNRIHRLISLAAIAALACALPVAAHHVGDDPTLAVSGVAGAETTVSGIIEELVVIDKVNATTQRYPILRQGDGSRVPLRGEAVQTLKTGSQVNVLGSRTGTSFTVDHVVSIAVAPKSAQVAAGLHRASRRPLHGRPPRQFRNRIQSVSVPGFRYPRRRDGNRDAIPPEQPRHRNGSQRRGHDRGGRP